MKAYYVLRYDNKALLKETDQVAERTSEKDRIVMWTSKKELARIFSTPAKAYDFCNDLIEKAGSVRRKERLKNCRVISNLSERMHGVPNEA
jgi:hypothetical protein